MAKRQWRSAICLAMQIAIIKTVEAGDKSKSEVAKLFAIPKKLNSENHLRSVCTLYSHIHCCLRSISRVQMCIYIDAHVDWLFLLRTLFGVMAVCHIFITRMLTGYIRYCAK